MIFSLFSPICLLLLFKSVLGPWQRLQDPRGLPHGLHGYWPVHHHLPGIGFPPLSGEPAEMSRKERRGGNVDCIHCGEFYVYVLFWPTEGTISPNYEIKDYIMLYAQMVWIYFLCLNESYPEKPLGHQMHPRFKVHADVTQFILH